MHTDEGKCASCRYAACFDYGPSPSGAEDGVNCTNRKMAEWLDRLNDWDFSQKELEEYGYMNLFRAEVLGSDEDPVICPCWESKRITDIPQAIMSAYVDLVAAVMKLVCNNKSQILREVWPGRRTNDNCGRFKGELGGLL